MRYQGYALGLVLAATLAFQRDTSHPDIIHVTAHYLQTVDITEYAVLVKKIKQGKKLTHIDADLVQEVSILASDPRKKDLSLMCSDINIILSIREL